MKTGRPLIKFDYADVERIVAESKTNLEASAKLGIGRETFNTRKSSDTAFRNAYLRGLVIRHSRNKHEIADIIIKPPKFKNDIEKSARIYARKLSITLDQARIYAKYRLYAKVYNKFTTLDDDWRGHRNLDRWKQETTDFINVLLADNICAEADIPAAKVLFCASMIGFRAGKIAEITGENIFFVRNGLNNLFEGGYFVSNNKFNTDWFDEKTGIIGFILDLMCVQGRLIRGTNES